MKVKYLVACDVVQLSCVARMLDEIKLKGEIIIQPDSRLRTVVVTFDGEPSEGEKAVIGDLIQQAIEEQV